MFYPVKTPWWLQQLYPGCIWKMPAQHNRIYLSFDDGPHPEVTPFVLDLLAEYEVKASFFCIGKNVEDHPDIYERIIAEGHAVGNHTHRHLNGWRTSDKEYLDDIVKANELIGSRLFRPPYGRATHFQLHCLRKAAIPFSIIMWTVLSGDFDPALSREACLLNVTAHLDPGNIIVFHDSKKAEEKIKYALPLVLESIKKKGFLAEKIVPQIA